ncbi:MAG: hypothetical protein F6K58_22400 [Symploca sp. SIO2E9]|nr:hypothetical protein [Symploca sp. SIO2E9]
MARGDGETRRWGDEFSAYCLLPTAYCLLPPASCLLPPAYCGRWGDKLFQLKVDQLV